MRYVTNYTKSDNKWVTIQIDVEKFVRIDQEHLT